jgi:aerobic carbon-monoxide dehydrogenase small subunit
MTAIDIQFSLNGQSRSCKVHPLTRLLDVIRDDFKLTGTKEGCGEGECGACSIFVDGKLVNSCLVPVAQAAGKTIETVENLNQKTSSREADLAKGENEGENDPSLNELQAAFLKYGGAQCGICTPGMLMAATALLRENQTPSIDDVRYALAGNLCRCTGYTKIIESVLFAAYPKGLPKNIKGQLEGAKGSPSSGAPKP